MYTSTFKQSERIGKSQNRKDISNKRYHPKADLNHQLFALDMIRRKAACSCGGGCPACQAKGSSIPISQPHDASEIEADQIADKVMRMPEANVTDEPIPQQGNSAKFIGRKCDSCFSDLKPESPISEEGSPLIQTKNSGTVPTNSGAESVQGMGLLRTGGGQPLSNSTKSFFEPRFAHDFSRVRIHTDKRAADSARAISAKAFTIGQDIAFASGRYQPDSIEGKRLLAHELTHTIQQPSKIARQDESDAHEPPIEFDIMVVDPSESQQLAERGIELPQASVVWSLLSPVFIERIQGVLTQNSLTPSPVPDTSPVSNPSFVVHDTAISMGSNSIARRVNQSRGPLGSGVAAWVPRTGDAPVARSDFFNRRRPTTSNFEQAGDKLSLQERLTNSRIVWQNTNAPVRRRAMRTVLAGLGLTADERESEMTAATAQLNENATSSDLIYSTAMWTADEISNQISLRGIETVVNNSTNTAVLQAAHDIIHPFFATRNQRIGSSVNVEIVQQTGSNCSPTGDVLPAYTQSQYTNVALLYLQAALQARRFPQITTHFLIDKNIGTHCDPRCFNLNNLYGIISTLLTYPAGVSFGITPQYGIGATDNVWWSDSVCGGSHP